MSMPPFASSGSSWSVSQDKNGAAAAVRTMKPVSVCSTKSSVVFMAARLYLKAAETVVIASLVALQALAARSLRTATRQSLFHPDEFDRQLFAEQIGDWVTCDEPVPFVKPPSW